MPRWRLVLMGLGALAVVIGIAADAGSLNRLQALVILFGLILLAVGWLGQRTWKVYRGLGLVVMNTLVLLLVIEIGAGGVAFFISDDGTNDATDILDSNVRDWRALPYYADKDWAADYWAEAANLTVRYEPYLMWRTANIRGDYINTTDDGLRVTPGADCDGDPFTIYALGGSTMWGAGAPDFGTIPAYLAEAFDGPLCVVNFGMAASVTTQGIIDLMLRLQAGQVPDLVIFYAGINEVQAAYESGAGDLHQNYALIVGRFRNPNFEFDTLGEALADELRDLSYAGRLLGRLADEAAAGGPVASYATMGVDADALADETVTSFLANVELVDDLSNEYGFDYAFFWQPVIAVEEKRLSPEEAPLRAGLDPALLTLYEAVYDRIAGLPPDYTNFYDIHDALKDESGQIYIDEFHITPDGNQIIAARMLDILREAGTFDEIE